MGRNFLKAHGDAANAILAAAGYNFRRLLAWLAILWRVLIIAVLAALADAAPASTTDARASNATPIAERQLLHRSTLPLHLVLRNDDASSPRRAPKSPMSASRSFVRSRRRCRPAQSPTCRAPRSTNSFMKIAPWPDGTNTNTASGASSSHPWRGRGQNAGFFEPAPKSFA